MSRLHTWVVRHVTYPAWQWRERGVVRPVLRELQRTQWLDPEALRALQMERLKAILTHAYQHVPYYRERWTAAGVYPDGIRGHEDLPRLPALEKDDVRDARAQLRATNVTGPLVERTTSGSTGIPLLVWVNPHARDAWVAAAFRARGWWDLRPGDRRISLISRSVLTRQRWLKQFLAANMMEFSAMELTEAVLDRLCRRLLDPSVRALMGYPSSLAYLARFIEDTNRPRPQGLRGVFVTGELLHRDVRELIRRALRAPVVDEYGSSETGHVAGECPYGRLHVAAENVIVEIDTDRTILLTDLTNVAMPMIRYRIGDLGRWGAPCPCGRGLPVLDVAVGRTEDLVVLPGGRLMDASVFNVVVDELRKRDVAFRQFRVIQHAVDRFEILVASTPPRDPASDGVARRLIDALGAPVAVDVRYVDVIPPERTGKRRRFVSRVAGLADGAGPGAATPLST